MSTQQSIHARFNLDRADFSLDVDLDLPNRGVTALFGHSGSGKTTLLRCIAGLERAQGELIMNGEVWQDANTFLPTHKRQLGYVFQEASLFPHLTARGNLEYGRSRAQYGSSGGMDRAALDHIVDLLGIGPLLDRRPDQLSGGERQRVGIARALAVKPKLLLMDEPLAALDLARKQEILPYLERLHEELEIPVLYVSHAPDEVARLADHIVVMRDGRAVASGALTETLARLDLPIHLGEDAGVVLDAVVAERDAQWQLARTTFSDNPDAGVWVRDGDHAIGHHVRVRILARDVSLAVTRHSGTSIQNILPGVVETLADDTHPALALVRVNVGGVKVVARLTRRSAHDLGLTPGQIVYAQIKAVALIG
jgi:molybdate transport system ATP-binding protein